MSDGIDRTSIANRISCHPQRHDPRDCVYCEAASFLDKDSLALEQTQAEQKLPETEILDKGKWIDEKDIRIKQLEPVLRNLVNKLDECKIRDHQYEGSDYFHELEAARIVIAIEPPHE